MGQHSILELVEADSSAWFNMRPVPTRGSPCPTLPGWPETGNWIAQRHWISDVSNHQQRCFLPEQMGVGTETHIKTLYKEKF